MDIDDALAKVKSGEMTEEIKTVVEALEEWQSFLRLYEQIQYHHEGMGCGIEDRGITDRYRACEYGWDRAMDKVSELLPPSN